jgi:hypothetical protein
MTQEQQLNIYGLVRLKIDGKKSILYLVIIRMNYIIDTFISFVEEENGLRKLRGHLRLFFDIESFDHENPIEILIQQFKKHLQTNGLENDFLVKFQKIIPVILGLFTSEFKQNGDAKFIKEYNWFLALFTYVAIKQMKIPEFSDFDQKLSQKLGENPDFEQVMIFIKYSPSTKLL